MAQSWQLGLGPSFWNFLPGHTLLQRGQEVGSVWLGQGHGWTWPGVGTYREVFVFRLQVVCDVLHALDRPRQGR